MNGSELVKVLKDNIQIISLICTILLAFIGYIVSYLNNLRINKRKDKLDYVNKQLNEFYGPLYVITQSSEITFKALQDVSTKRKYRYINQDSPKKKGDLSQWEIWLKEVFIPTYDMLDKLIIEKSYLINDNDFPDCLKRIIAHNAGYKVLIKNWEMGNFKENKSIVKYPDDLVDYARDNYLELKQKQAKLIGKN